MAFFFVRYQIDFWFIVTSQVNRFQPIIFLRTTAHYLSISSNGFMRFLNSRSTNFDIPQSFTPFFMSNPPIMPGQPIELSMFIMNLSTLGNSLEVKLARAEKQLRFSQLVPRCAALARHSIMSLSLMIDWMPSLNQKRKETTTMQPMNSQGPWLKFSTRKLETFFPTKKSYFIVPLAASLMIRQIKFFCTKKGSSLLNASFQISGQMQLFLRRVAVYIDPPSFSIIYTEASFYKMSSVSQILSAFQISPASKQQASLPAIPAVTINYINLSLAELRLESPSQRILRVVGRVGKLYRPSLEKRLRANFRTISPSYYPRRCKRKLPIKGEFAMIGLMAAQCLRKNSQISSSLSSARTQLQLAGLSVLASSMMNFRMYSKVTSGLFKSSDTFFLNLLFLVVVKKLQSWAESQFAKNGRSRSQ